jgi:hypothetical protein
MIKFKDLLENINITNKNNDFIEVDILNDENKKIGNFALETYDGLYYTITDAKIDPSFRGKGYYYKSLLQLIDKYPNITIVSAFRSSEADRAWSALKQNIGNKYNLKTKKEDGELVHYLSKK